MTEQLKYPEVRRRITAARTAMIMDEPFFGTLALRLKLVEEPDCSCTDPKKCRHTAWVDGQSLGYYPKFIQSLKQKMVTSLLVHEVMHCANGHPWRRGNRDPRRANEAMDRAINPVIRDAGYELPPDGMYELEPSHKGKSFEWIYDRLPQPKQQPKKQPNQSASQDSSGSAPPESGSGAQGQDSKPPEGKPGSSEEQSQAQDSVDTQGQEKPGKPGSKGSSSTGQDSKPDAGPSGSSEEQSQGKESLVPPTQSLGEVRDAPTENADPDEPVPTEGDWKQAVQQAAALAKGRGKMPAALKRFAIEAAETRIDWRSAMMRFAQEIASADYSFARPNQRYVAHNLYLPALYNHEVGDIAIGVDVSGSVDQVLLNQFAGNLNAIVDDVKPRRVRVLYCDTQIHREVTFEKGDEIKLEAVGGGGTDFRPVFNAIVEWDEPPVCIIYLTDLMGTFPDEDPNIPTLWVTGEARPRPVPFGDIIVAD